MKIEIGVLVKWLVSIELVSLEVQVNTNTSSLVKWTLMQILRVVLAMLLIWWLRWLCSSPILQRCQIPFVQIYWIFSVYCLINFCKITLSRAVAPIYDWIIVLPKFSFAVIHILRKVLSLIAKIRCFSVALIDRPWSV